VYHFGIRSVFLDIDQSIAENVSGAIDDIYTYWIQSAYFIAVFYSLYYLEHVCLLHMKDINESCTGKEVITIPSSASSYCIFPFYMG
jgi:hypothetical protein